MRSLSSECLAQSVAPPASIESQAPCGYKLHHQGETSQRRVTMRGLAGSEGTVLVCGAYLLPFMRILLPRTDEGTFLEGAVRIVHGQVFGRDFVEVMGPGSFYWLAAFYKIFGINFLATRVSLFLSWILTVFVVHRLCAGIRPAYRLLPVLLIVVTSFSSIGVGISHHIESNCLSMLFVLTLDSWRKERSMRWLFVSGMLGALTALVHQPKGLLLLASAGAWLWIQEREDGGAVRALRAFTAGAIALIAVIGGYFAAKGALFDALNASFVWPFQHYSAVNNVPYAYGTFAFNWRGVPLSTPGSYLIFLFSCVLMVPFLYVAVLPALTALLVLARRSRGLPPELSLYLWCGVSVWLSELHRKDIVHLVFGSPLLIIACVQLLSVAETRVSRAVLVLLTTSSFALAACNLLVALTAHTVATRVGNIAVFDGGEEVAALNAYITPGEPIFAYPYCPSYYFLTQATNVTRFSVLQSGYNTPDQVAEVIGSLESKRVKHVLWDTNFRVRSLALVFPAALRMPDDLAPLEAYLRGHYRTVYSRKGFEILERRQDAR